MNSSSTQFVSSRRMEVYEPIHQFGMWEENFKCNSNMHTSGTLIMEADTKLDDHSDNASLGSMGLPHKYEQEATRPNDKTLRRLAQNREAARKSRQRKKAYVQQLEKSRLKLVQLEQELEKARQQGLYAGGGAFDVNQMGFSGAVNSGVTTFEMEYRHWVEEQNSQISELRTALRADISDRELEMLVKSCLDHYIDLFRMKAIAAKSDVFYVLYGMWKTPVERFFFWIGGFRPSEILKVLEPQLETLTNQQHMDVIKLTDSCQQAEDALRQGMEKLQQTLTDSVVAGRLGDGSYPIQMSTAMERLENLVSFVNQADYLRQETLQQMKKILSIRQSAHGLLVLGDYFHRLRAFSLVWANCSDHQGVPRCLPGNRIQLTYL